MNTSVEEINSTDKSVSSEDYMKYDSPWGLLAVGMTVGIIFGFIATLIFAPKSGRESRELIKQQVGEKLDDVRGRVKEITADRRKAYTESWKQPKAKPYNEEFST